jgi:hypothetical protein
VHFQRRYIRDHRLPAPCACVKISVDLTWSLHQLQFVTVTCLRTPWILETFISAYPAFVRNWHRTMRDIAPCLRLWWWMFSFVKKLMVRQIAGFKKSILLLTTWSCHVLKTQTKGNFYTSTANRPGRAESSHIIYGLAETQDFRHAYALCPGISARAKLPLLLETLRTPRC